MQGRPGLLIVGLVAVLAARVSFAGSLSVSPTTVEIPRAGGMAVLYVTNHGVQPIMAQVEGFDWHQSQGVDRLEPSSTLQVSPPMARLEPGESQTVRILVEPVGTEAGERAFRLLVSELPDPSEDNPGKVHILLQFSVPVFVNTPSGAKARLAWNAKVAQGGLRLTAHNHGRARAKLAKLTLVTSSGKQLKDAQNALHYVLAGANRTWTFRSAGIAAGESLRIKGVDVQAGKPFETTVDVQP